MGSLSEVRGPLRSTRMSQLCNHVTRFGFLAVNFGILGGPLSKKRLKTTGQK
jgi:hypothetical protein